VSGGELSAGAQARRAAGRAVRRLGHGLVGHEASDELLGDVATTLDELTDRLDAGARRARQPAEFGHREGTETERGAPIESYDDRPFSGAASPWGLDLEAHRVGEGIEASVTLGAAHEGAPGRSHGGIVAGLFDDVFGFVLGILGQPAFTGRLEIRYVQGTPLHRLLSCRVRAVGREGRKISMEGELVDVETDEVLVRSTALFIAVDPSIHFSAERPAPPDED
jgi:hypothetical protein